MKISNTTQKKVLAEHAKHYRNFLTQSIGLIGRTKAVPLLFDLKKEKKQGIHMWFVFCSIDVLFLDKNKKIVEIKRNFKPFQCYTTREKARYILELPAGDASSCRIGDRVSFK